MLYYFFIITLFFFSILFTIACIWTFLQITLHVLNIVPWSISNRHFWFLHSSVCFLNSYWLLCMFISSTMQSIQPTDVMLFILSMQFLHFLFLSFLFSHCQDWQNHQISCSVSSSYKHHFLLNYKHSKSDSLQCHNQKSLTPKSWPVFKLYRLNSKASVHIWHHYSNYLYNQHLHPCNQWIVRDCKSPLVSPSTP